MNCNSPASSSASIAIPTPVPGLDQVSAFSNWTTATIYSPPPWNSALRAPSTLPHRLLLSFTDSSPPSRATCNKLSTGSAKTFWHVANRFSQIIIIMIIFKGSRTVNEWTGLTTRRHTFTLGWEKAGHARSPLVPPLTAAVMDFKHVLWINVPRRIQRSGWHCSLRARLCGSFSPEPCLSRICVTAFS